jgi:hypothetical protein
MRSDHASPSFAWWQWTHFPRLPSAGATFGLPFQAGSRREGHAPGRVAFDQDGAGARGHPPRMRTITARLLVFTGLIAAAGEEPAPPGVGFAWLTGTWRMEDGDTICDEIWGEPRGGSQFGAFRLTRGDTTGFYEIFAIEKDARGVHLRLRHFSPGLEPWKDEASGPTSWRLVSARDGEAVFESASSRVTYRRPDAETLVARLEPIPAKEGQGSTFTFRRVAGRSSR